MIRWGQSPGRQRIRAQRQRAESRKEQRSGHQARTGHTRTQTTGKHRGWCREGLVGSLNSKTTPENRWGRRGWAWDQGDSGTGQEGRAVAVRKRQESRKWNNTDESRNQTILYYHNCVDFISHYLFIQQPPLKGVELLEGIINALIITYSKSDYNAL